MSVFCDAEGKMHVGDKNECLMAMDDYDTKNGYVYEQHEHLYT